MPVRSSVARCGAVRCDAYTHTRVSVASTSQISIANGPMFLFESYKSRIVLVPVRPPENVAFLFPPNLRSVTGGHLDKHKNRSKSIFFRLARQCIQVCKRSQESRQFVVELLCTIFLGISF
jgi:hypothetical protein